MITMILINTKISKNFMFRLFILSELKQILSLYQFYLGLKLRSINQYCKYCLLIVRPQFVFVAE